MDRREVEIMAPVGSWETLMAAIQGGAGSVYFGVGHLNMRSRSSANFSLDDMKKIAETAVAKGIKTYLKDYCEPMFIMAPLNIIGELAKVISISFRLFGNIMGGAIIILVVSYLTYSIITPPFLNAFFGAFVGTIQAFVFTMLTVVYIAVQVK